jgi:hypothetical protein
MPRVQLRYGDKVLDSGSGGVHRHLNPYTGQVQAEIPLAGQTEVDEAVELAAAQAEAWRRWAPERRRDVLMRFAGLLDEHRAEFAALQALDGGTPTHFGQRIIDNSVNWTRYYAGWCDKLSGELISTLDTRGYFCYTAPSRRSSRRSRRTSTDGCCARQACPPASAASWPAARRRAPRWSATRRWRRSASPAARPRPGRSRTCARSSSSRPCSNSGRRPGRHRRVPALQDRLDYRAAVNANR